MNCVPWLVANAGNHHNKLTNKFQITTEVLARDPDHPLPSTSFARTCKQLYNENVAMILKQFKFVHIEIHKDQDLARGLASKVKGMVFQPYGSEKHVVADFADYSMKMVICPTAKLTSCPAHLMIIDQESLYEFAKQLVLLREYNISDRHTLKRYKYSIRFSHTPTRGIATRLKLETQLLQPLFDFWWGDFNRLRISCTTDTSLKLRLEASVRSNRWNSVDHFLDYLDRAHEDGQEAFLQNDFVKAYGFFQNAHDVKIMTINSSQGFQFVNDHFRMHYVTRWTEVFIRVLSDLVRVMLCLAEDTVYIQKRPHLCSEVFQRWQHAYFRLGGVYVGRPSDEQMGDILYLGARACRTMSVRGSRLPYLGKALIYLEAAAKLCPHNNDIVTELALVRQVWIEHRATINWTLSGA